MLSQFTYGTTYCCIEHTSNNNEQSINGLILHKMKESFEVHSSFNGCNYEEITSYVDPNQHFYLIVNSDKVLYKSLNEIVEPTQAVNLAFPNLKLDDFYFETYISNDTTYVAICRKDVVQLLLNYYQNLGYKVTGFSLGNLAISQLEGISDKTTLSTSNAIIEFKENQIVGIQHHLNKKDAVTVNGLEITNFGVLPLAGILTYYTNQKKTTSNFEEVNNELKNTFKQQHIFNLGLKISLATIFVLLLFSFIFFTNYTAKIEELTATVSLNETQKTTYLKLTSEVQQKERLFQEYSLSSSKASWYVDQIGLTIPESVSLSEMEWQPLTNNIEAAKLIQPDLHIILIKGTSTIATDFSKWLTTLEQLKWVEKVAINHYGSDKKVNTSFELQISFTI